MAHHASTHQHILEQLPSTDNPILDELLQIMLRRFASLVDKGFLAPHFLTRMAQSPQEVIKFIRQNRAVVADTLNKRLNKRQRPTREQLEQQGIVPRGYFNYGHQLAMKSKHRRKSTAGQDLEMQLKLRPKKEDIIRQGVVNKQEMEYGGYYELDDTKLDGMMHEDNQYYDEDDDFDDDEQVNGVTLMNHSQHHPEQAGQADAHRLRQRMIGGGEQQEQIPWQISILSSLLFKTIQEALQKSCLDTQHQENMVLQEMVEMNNEMKSLRDVLDKYFLSNDVRDAVLHEEDENLVRDKFHSIQEKLLHISTRQNRIHEKLRILHSVERSMVSLQNNYQIRLSTLKKTEMQILRDLQQQKQRRDRALKIMHAEKSHQSWAMTKLDYTINVAKHYNETREHRQESAHDAELKEDKEFVSELETFLSNLRNISEHQKQIVNEDEQSINDLESRLLQIRYDMNKVRTLTFKKIYDLHKQVQIAESLELGYRRLSVASATEIERERRHHSIKIQRQLHTLNAQIKAFNYKLYEKNFREIIDIEIIMSNSKLKAFFGVYLQTAAQTIIDIELSYNNLNASLPPIDGGTSNLVVNDLYGIETVVNSVKIRLNAESDMIEEEEQSLNDKLTKCYKFLKKIKKAIKMERQKAEDHDKEEEEEEEEEEDETMQNGDEPEVDGVQISIDTLNLIEHNNAAHDGSVDDSDVVLSNPELLAMLQKPASLYFRPKKRNILRGALMQQLKTCDLDELPRESPFK
mmetsp:Transcript_2642/g.4297  ORF Transcript_2642/g.4297 Transcript_2642/m.4297 type:complete len:747 (+) Transcript_2642:97-2337(+)